MIYVDNSKTQHADSDYIRRSMKAPLLEKEHELTLARRWREEQDETALHELIEAYSRLVIAIASKFRFYGLPQGDLIQEGHVGLMIAANKFDPDRDLRFSTYASWWVKSCIQDYILRNWSIVRTGTTAAHKSLFFNFRRLRAKIESMSEREGLTDDDRAEIANDLNVRMADVEHMEGRLSGVDSSLNMSVGEEEGDEWQSLLPSQSPNPEDVVMGMKDAETRSEWLNHALDTLPEREQMIINKRHLGDEVVTLDSLGKELGISKERVRQLEERAIGRLKDNILAAHIEGGFH